MISMRRLWVIGSSEWGDVIGGNVNVSMLCRLGKLKNVDNEMLLDDDYDL